MKTFQYKISTTVCFMNNSRNMTVKMQFTINNYAKYQKQKVPDHEPYTLDLCW